MENRLLKNIEKNAVEKTLEFHLYHNTLELSFQREQRRITNPLPKKIQIPQEWGVDRKFNPFYVLKKKKQISRSIARKILNKTYQPKIPYIRIVPKKGGENEKLVYIKYQILLYLICFITLF